MFDADYVARLTAGDPAVEQHFTTYFSDLLRIKLRSKLRSAQAVEDVRQETFLRVFGALRRKHSLEHPERLGAFVNSVCNNVLLETYRATARSPQAAEEFDMADTGTPADEGLVNDERRQQVRKVLAELPEKDRCLLEMVFLQERDKDEICRQFSVDRDHLRVLLHRARVRFKAGFLAREVSAAERSGV